MLLVEGHEVRLLLRRPKEGLSPGFETALGHLGDPDSLSRAAEGVRAVVHCAALSGVWGPLSHYIENNAMGTARLIKAARQAGARYFVHTSTFSVVYSRGPQEGVDESRPYMADTAAPYAYSKMLAERETLLANGPGFNTVSIRPHLIWGPGDRHILPRLVDRARRGRLFLFSGGPYLVEATYIDNAARAHLTALFKLAEGAPVDGQAFFIGQGRPQDLNSLVASLLKAVKAPPVRAVLPPRLGRVAARTAEWIWGSLGLGGEPPLTSFALNHLIASHWPDISKARRLLGYAPEVTVEEGLERLARAADSGYLQP
jgi:nucleoside-diphosphate-sugar epimerase